MALSDYLTSKYLSADTSSKSSGSKKRKRGKDTSSNSNPKSALLIADDDDSHNSWTHLHGTNTENEIDDGNPTIVSDPSHISSRTATWTTIGSSAPTNAEQAAADAILAKAESERSARARAELEDDAPAIVGDLDNDDSRAGGGGETSEQRPQMASGAMAGLQTAAQVAAALEKRTRDERRAMEEQGLDPSGKATETIYRDASGRVINVAMKRAELRRKAEEEERAAKEAKEAALGDVQRREKEEKKSALQGAKYLSVARYADDKELNDEMRGKQRWNDPAARFLSNPSAAGKEDGAVVRGGKKSRKKVYEGASEPNRYGIKPGFRWDGVDRSNGFERKWFAARNKKANEKQLAYDWEMDE